MARRFSKFTFVKQHPRVQVTSAKSPTSMAKRAADATSESFEDVLVEMRRCIAGVHRALYAQSNCLGTGQTGTENVQKSHITESHRLLVSLSRSVSDMERKWRELNAMGGNSNA